MKLYRLAIFLAVVGVILLTTPTKSLDSSTCADYEFIFARGSGQTLNDVDYQTFKAEVDEVMKKVDIKYDFYELGTKNDGYPAFAPDSLTSVLGTYLSAGESYKFGESVKKGVEELISHLKTESGRCKKKEYILAGYSQGAFVIDKTLPYLSSRKIFYVATFGDPKLYLPEGKTHSACRNIGLSSYRIYVPDCEVEEGVLGGMNPYEGSNFNNKRGAWCNQNDFICGSRLVFPDLWKGHTAYIGENGYKKFANLVVGNISDLLYSSRPETEARYSGSKKRDIVIINDCQKNPISDNLKNRLVELTEHGTRVAIYNVYTHLNFAKHIEEVIPFTNDQLGEKIDDLNRKILLENGGIVSSYNNLPYAIKYVSKNAKWEQGSEKNIYIYSNSSYKSSVSFDGTTLDEAVSFANNANVKVSLLGEHYNYGRADILKMTRGTGGEEIGSGYGDIILNQDKASTSPKYFSKTFKLNQSSKYTVVIINDLVYGVSDKDKIVIKNLDENRLNNIVFLEMDEQGSKKDQKSFRFGTEKTPDSGVLSF